MRQLRVLVIPILVATGLSAVSAIASTTTASAASASAPWHVSSYLNRLGVTLDRVSCSSASHCTTIEAGRLLTTPDGGATWTDETALVPTDALELTDVSCPTDTRCYLTALAGVGTPVVYRVDTGALTTATPTGATPSLPAIDCPAADVCFTTEGRSLFRTSDAGATWSALPLGTALATSGEYPGGRAGRGLAVSCAPGTETCAVVGNTAITSSRHVVAEFTADGGQHWAPTASPRITGSSGPVSVDCVSSTTCYAATDPDGWVPATFSTVDSGATWPSRPDQYGLGSQYTLSCGAAATCAIVGNPDPGLGPESYSLAILTTTFRTWKASTRLPSTLGDPAVSCPTATNCLIVSDGAATFTSNRGRAWTAVELAASRRTISRLDCPSVARCIGVGPIDSAHPQVAVTGAPAGPWTRTDLPVSLDDVLLDLDCPTTQVCYASERYYVANQDGPGTVFRSADGGRTWTPSTVTGADLTDVSCPTATVCLGSSDYIGRMRRTASAGSKWVTASPPQPSDIQTIFSTACSSATDCIVHGMLHDKTVAVWTTTDFGATWVQHPLAYSGNFADCSGTLCVLSNDTSHPTTLAVSTDGGTTWTTTLAPTGVRLLRRVSCGSATACAISADDTSGNSVVVSTADAGSTWHVSTLPPLGGTPSLSNISCAGGTCFITGFDPYGRPTVFTGAA